MGIQGPRAGSYGKEEGGRKEAALCDQPAPEGSWEGQAGAWSCVSGKGGSREKRKRWEEGQREKKAVKGKKKEEEKESREGGKEMKGE